MRLLVIDDHAILCAAFADFLKKACFEIGQPVTVDTAVTLPAGVQMLRHGEPGFDLVFLDLNLDATHKGAETLRVFRQITGGCVRVVVFTGLPLTDPATVSTLRICLTDLGADGVLSKAADKNDVMLGLRHLLSGKRWVPNELSLELLKPIWAAGPRARLGLTPREWEVARLLADGMTDKEIARSLNLKVTYVRQVTSQKIFPKLGVKNRTEAALAIAGGER